MNFQLDETGQPKKYSKSLVSEREKGRWENLLQEKL
jgi:hypothetical protein